MQRRIMTIAVASLLVACFVGLSFAGQGNFRKGKYLYRKNCRTCHSPSGQATDLSPSSKLQAEWIKAFDNYKSLKCADKWQGLSEQDRLDIFTYMHDFAKDSPSPAKCG